jgi:hypothetical protein
MNQQKPDFDSIKHREEHLLGSFATFTVYPYRSVGSMYLLRTATFPTIGRMNRLKSSRFCGDNESSELESNFKRSRDGLVQTEKPRRC